MPDLRQTLIFEVRSKDLGKHIKDLDKMEAEFKGVGKSATQAKTKVGAFGKSLPRVGEFLKRHIVRVGVAAFASITAAMAAATKMAVSFQQGMAEVGTLVDTTTVNMQRLSNGLLTVAKNVPESIDNLTAALYQTVSAGVDASEALGIVEQAARAAKAGATDTRTAVDGLTTVLNAFSLATSDAESVTDAFFVAVRDGKTTFGELAASIGQVAPIAAQLGVSYEEVLASTAALTKAGVSTSEAMTQIRSALVAVAKQTTETQKASAELGIEFTQAALKSKGFQQFLADATKAAGGNAEVLTNLFGRIEGVSAAMALGGAQADDFAATLGNMDTRAGSTAEAFAKMMDTASGLWDVIKSRLSVAFVDLGTKTLPLVASALENIIALFEFFDSDAEKLLRRLKELGASPDLILEAKLKVDIEEAQQAVIDATDTAKRALGQLEETTSAGVGAAGQTLRNLFADEIEGVARSGEEALRLYREQLRLIAIDAASAGGAESRRAADAKKGLDVLDDLIAAEVARKAAADDVIQSREQLAEVEERLLSGTQADSEAAIETKKDELIVTKELTKEQIAAAKKAAEFVEAMTGAVAVQKILKDLTDEARGFGEELAGILEEIKQIEEAETQLVNPDDIAAAKALREEFERQRDALVKQLADYEKAQAALDNLVGGAEAVGVAMLEGLDPAAIEAAIETIIRQMKEDLDRADLTATIDIARLDLTTDAGQLRKTQIEAELAETKALYRAGMAGLADTLLAELPNMATAITAIFRSAMAGLSPEAREAGKAVADNFRDALSRASRDLDLGGSLKDFRKQVDTAFTKAVSELEKMRDATKISNEEFDESVKTLEAIREAAIDAARAFDALAEAAIGVGAIVDEVADLADALGLVSEEALEGVKNFGKLVRSAGELKGAITAISAATDVLGVLGGVGAAVGAATGIVGALGGLISSGDSGEEQRQARESIEQMKRLREETARLQMSLADNARRVADAVDRLIRSDRIGGDVSQIALDEFRRLFDAFIARETGAGIPQEAIDAFRNLPFIEQIPILQAAAAEMGITLNELLDQLHEFSQGVTPDEFIALIESLRDAGAISDDLFQSLMSQLDTLVELDPSDLSDQLLRLVQDVLGPALDELEQGLGGFAPTVDGALTRLRIMSSLLGDSNQAIQDFVNTLLAADPETGAAIVDPDSMLARFLQDLIDATDAEARQVIFDQIADLIGRGEFEFGTLTPNQVDSILAPFRGLSDPAAEAGASISDALSDAAQAARDFAQFIDGEDVQGAFDAFINSMRAGGDEVSEGLANFIDTISDIDLGTEEGQRRLRDFIEIIGDQLATGNTSLMEGLGLTEEGLRQLAQILLGFTIPELAPPDESVDVLAVALRNLGLELDVLGSDVTGALRRFIQAITAGAEDLDADLADLLERAQTLDLSSDAGRQRLKTIIEQLTRGIIAGTFGGDDETAEDILSVLRDMLARSEPEDEFSRSVQIARTITEIQANEVVTLLNDLNFTADQIHRLLSARLPMAQAFPNLSPAVITGDVGGAPPVPQLMMTNTFDIVINTEQSLDRIKRELEREVSLRYYDAFPAGR